MRPSILPAFRAAATPVLSVVIGLLLSGLIIWLAGGDPVAAFRALIEGAFVGRRSIELTILNAIPLMFTGLSVVIAFRAGLFNIGAEGQLMVGGVAAAALGAKLALGSILTPISALAGATAAGVLWAWPAAWLKGRRGIHEVITTLMLTYIAFHFTAYCRRYPLFDPASTSQSSITVPPEARLPRFGALFEIVGLPEGRLHLGLLIALAACVLCWIFLYRTVWGYEIRAVEDSAQAAAAAGIDGGRTLMIALCAGGALAGLGGGVQLLGLYYRISTDSFVGLGFAGFFIALLARNNPLAVIPAALFFGALRAGALNMQFEANIPINMADLTQGLIILVLATPMASRLLSWRPGRRIGRHA